MGHAKPYIGSTDAPVLLGLTEWTTEEEIVRRIVYGEEKQHEEKKETMFRLAKRLEPVIMDEFTHHTGLQWLKAETVYHKVHPFIASTPDGLVDAEQIIEAKTALGFFNAQKKWDGGVPQNYQAQCQHHMMCTGAKLCWMPVLFGIHRFELLKVERDDEFIAGLLQIEVNFWNTKILPELKLKEVAA
jgi:putative phage-type endonuclease